RTAPPARCCPSIRSTIVLPFLVHLSIPCKRPLDVPTPARGRSGLGRCCTCPRLCSLNATPPRPDSREHLAIRTGAARRLATALRRRDHRRMAHLPPPGRGRGLGRDRRDAGPHLGWRGPGDRSPVRLVRARAGVAPPP